MFSKLLNQIDHCLLRLISLSDFEDWLVAHLQEILDSGEQDAIEMANQIDADFAEYSQGILDEQTIFDNLHSYFSETFTVNFQLGEFIQPQQTTTIDSLANSVIKRDIYVTPGEDLRLPVLPV